MQDQKKHEVDFDALVGGFPETEKDKHMAWQKLKLRFGDEDHLNSA